MSVLVGELKENVNDTMKLPCRSTFCNLSFLLSSTSITLEAVMAYWMACSTKGFVKSLEVSTIVKQSCQIFKYAVEEKSSFLER